jgi:hypothetical protein
MGKTYFPHTNNPCPHPRPLSQRERGVLHEDLIFFTKEFFYVVAKTVCGFAFGFDNSLGAVGRQCPSAGPERKQRSRRIGLIRGNRSAIGIYLYLFLFLFLFF